MSVPEVRYDHLCIGKPNLQVESESFERKKIVQQAAGTIATVFETGYIVMVQPSGHYIL